MSQRASAEVRPKTARSTLKPRQTWREKPRFKGSFGMGQDGVDDQLLDLCFFCGMIIFCDFRILLFWQCCLKSDISNVNLIGFNDQDISGCIQDAFRIAKFNDSNSSRFYIKDGVELSNFWDNVSHQVRPRYHIHASKTPSRGRSRAKFLWIRTMPKLIPISSKEDVGGKIGADWNRKGTISSNSRGAPSHKF